MPTDPEVTILPCPFCNGPADRASEDPASICYEFFSCADGDCAGFLCSALAEAWNRRANRPAAQAGQGWISVEERLPDAGEFVMVFVVEGKQTRRLRAFYAPKHTIEQTYDSDWTDYSEEKDEYFLPVGWYEANHYEETHWRISDGVVTDWLPLPAPPAHLAAERGK